MLFERPTHPYTQGLLASMPSLEDEQERLAAIPGTVPDPFALPSGLPLRSRAAAMPSRACSLAEPPLIECEAAHAVACIRPAATGVGATAPSSNAPAACCRSRR